MPSDRKRCYFYNGRGLCMVEIIDIKDEAAAIARARTLFEKRRLGFLPPIKSLEPIDAHRAVYQHAG